LSPTDGATVRLVSIRRRTAPLYLSSTGRWVYALGEESSTIAFFHYDTVHGMLALRQTISSLPAGFSGTSFTSELYLRQTEVSLAASFCTIPSRSAQSMATVGSTLLAETSTMGDYPRQLHVNPSGEFFYVCNQRSDRSLAFKVRRETGLLTFYRSVHAGRNTLHCYFSYPEWKQKVLSMKCLFCEGRSGRIRRHGTYDKQKTNGYEVGHESHNSLLNRTNRTRAEKLRRVRFLVSVREKKAGPEKRLRLTRTAGW